MYLLVGNTIVSLRKTIEDEENKLRKTVGTLTIQWKALVIAIVLALPIQDVLFLFENVLMSIHGEHNEIFMQIELKYFSIQGDCTIDLFEYWLWTNTSFRVQLRVDNWFHWVEWNLSLEVGISTDLDTKSIFRGQKIDFVSKSV